MTHNPENTYPPRESDGRTPYEFSGVLYLRDDEVEKFENDLENAICPSDTEPHDCRLGIWTYSKQEITCAECDAKPAPHQGHRYEDEYYCEEHKSYA